MDNKLALLLIGLGASLWGIIGVFVTYLYEMGFTPGQVVALRSFSAALLLVTYTFFKNRRLLKIRWADSKYFVGTGIISIVFFNWCLFSAIEETSISIASILLYTAPAFVAIFSRIFFKEALTPRKVSALFITFLGCSFVIGILPNMNETISLYGFILGLGSGFFYALYSIFGKFALQKYDSLTVTVYTFLFAAAASIPVSGVWQAGALLSDIKAWGCIIGLGVLSTALPFILYTKGLSKVESSKASIIATIEPVVASLVGFLIFHETLHAWQYIGIVLVISAVIIVQEPVQKSKKPSAVSKQLSS
ncbi:DMT family transporter [Pseudobacillus badius]|uniref:DMT family transporter n=1 Tax=Bacillus badius TaxID=1455 RepID=UPI0007B08737|nr:EamA family transporter [Bacillus badius]KZN99066.1 transporter [Bacillus badius]OCS84004.1 transporter [Bacillus badius]OVE52700.1 EamA family transporter [Bacillus badius]TDW04715.1 threonine/homoserine efflux transporter RhtA [Bacillus badius]UAT29157.1 EamA family transporter [Bacillus badius]